MSDSARAAQDAGANTSNTGNEATSQMRRPGDERRISSAVIAPDVVLSAIVLVPVAIAVVATVRWVAMLIANAGRGLDVSDEAYYLLSASRPSDSEATASDFGFYLRPLLWLSGGSLRSFRLAGLLLVLVGCLAGAAAAIGLAESDRPRSMAGRVGVLVAATALVSATTLTYYGLWLPTPSYNLLNLSLMLLVAACLITGGRTLTRLRESGSGSTAAELHKLWPLVALGALLVVGATIKATSYLAAAFVCALCLAFVAGRCILAAARAALVGALAGAVVHWGLIAGTPVGDLRRLHRGLQALGRLKSHSASQLWEIHFLLNEVVPWFGALGLGVLAIWITWRSVRSPRTRAALIVSCATVAAVMLWDGRPRGGPAVLSDATGWWWLRLGTLSLVWISALAPRRCRLLIVGPCVTLLGVAASAGSNVGVVSQIGLCAGLIGLGVLTQAFVVVSSMDRSHTRSLAAIPAALFFVLASVASNGAIQGARENPYRLGAPLSASSQLIGLGRFGSVKVTPGAATYITGLQALAGQLTDQQRACLIDLTGGTPASAIALDARPAGAAWLLGGYAGSSDAADFWLSLDPCVRGPIALIEAPDGLRSIPRPAWLSERELRFVGEVEYNGYLHETQRLYVTDDNATRTDTPVP